MQRDRVSLVMDRLESRLTMSAQLQIVNNSPYIDARVVDVYVDDARVINDLQYTRATAWLTVDSGVDVDIDITAGDATNNQTPLLSQTVSLTEDGSYVAMLVGDPGQSTGTQQFQLVLADDARRTANSPPQIDVRAFHGVPDAPVVDFVLRGKSVIANDLAYPTFSSDYVSIATDSYIVDVTNADGTSKLGRFNLNLNAASGKSLVLAVTGFENPPSSTDPAFGLLAIFGDGSTSKLTVAPPTTRIQIIHNSPFANAASVDVYVGGERKINDLTFRQATPYIDVPAETNLTIDIVPGDATNNDNPLFTTTTKLAEEQTYTVVAIGNPSLDTGMTAFRLVITDGARETISGSSGFEARVFNGVPDGPLNDVKVRGMGTLANDLEFGTFSDAYSALTDRAKRIDIAREDGVLRLGSFNIDLADLQGKPVVLLQSGFFTSPGEDDPGFGLFAVLPDGTSIGLPTTLPLAENVYAVGGIGAAKLYLPNGTSTISGNNLFPGSTSAVRVASGDINGDGTLDMVFAAPPGQAPLVVIVDGATGETLNSFFAFEQSFLGGLFVSVAEINNDGHDDIIISPDEGGGPRVRIISGFDTNVALADFFGIEDPNFRGGARVAFGDLNGDDRFDLLVGAGFGGGPRVALFDGPSLLTSERVKLVADFFVFESSLRNGVFLSAGDLDGDLLADPIVGGGPGGGPRIQAYRSADLLGSGVQVSIANFYAGNPDSRTGVRLVAKDLDGDGLVDVVASSGDDDGTVRTYLGNTLDDPAPIPSNPFQPFGTTIGGVFVG